MMRRLFNLVTAKREMFRSGLVGDVKELVLPDGRPGGDKEGYLMVAWC
jgi:hypothetical protein